MREAQLWWFLPVGYLFTVAIETPFLIFGLSARHPLRRKFFSGLWLTACTYPIVVLVLPLVFGNSSRFAYLVTVAIETPVLLLCLSTRHSTRRRFLSGLWLTACTYPIVVLVLPLLFGNSSRFAYLATAETFAPAAECALFWITFGKRDERGRASMWRDFAAITAANLASFALGELLNLYDWFGVIG